MLRILLALALLAGPALADTTVQVQPPAYIVTPPKTSGPYRVTPIPFPVTIPDPAALAAHGARLDALEAAVRALQAVPVASVPAATPAAAQPAPVATGGTLRGTVGPGQQFARVGDGMVACMAAGCTDLFLTVYPVPKDPAYYVDDASKSGVNPATGRGWVNQFDFNATIEAADVRDAAGARILPRFSISAPDALYYRKAIFIPMRDFTMRGIDCDGGSVGHSYQLACVRPEATAGRAQNILLENNVFHGWANGNLGTMTGGTWTGNFNYYHDNGPDSGDGNSHGLYVATVDRLVSNGEMSVRVHTGHLFKTRSKETIITNGRFFDLEDGDSSYGIDVPEGGKTTISDTIIQRGPKALNGPAMAIGEEIRSPLFAAGIVASDGRPQSITLRNVTIVSNTPPDTPFLGTLGLWNRMNVPVTATGTKFFGPPRTAKMNNGTGDVAWPGDVTWLSAMPALDLTPPMFAATP